MQAGAAADRTLDARGLNCPMPILKAKKALNEMTAGSLLKVLATDPGAVRDRLRRARRGAHRPELPVRRVGAGRPRPERVGPERLAAGVNVFIE